MPHFANILVAIDFSDGSRRATKTAIDLARKTGATIQLLSVHDIPIVAAYADTDIALGPPGGVVDAFASTREAQRFRLAELRDEIIAGGVEAVAHMGEGEPSTTIVTTAEDLGADLIVMGTHGRTGLQRFLIGSVAEKVVRNAACPVMTVSLFDHGAEVAEAS